MKKFSRTSSKHGTPPGTASYIGDKEPTKTSINITQYTNDSLEETMLDSSLANPLIYFENLNTKEATNTWIHVAGLKNIKLIQNLCEKFEIHPLIIEDILNTQQRPKTDYIDDCIYSIIRINDSKDQETCSQVSLILIGDIVLTFQEQAGNHFFQPIQKRIQTSKSRIRREGSDYLFYALLDVLIDGFFPLLEEQSDAIETLDELLIEKPSKAFLQELYTFKKKSMTLRKNIQPLKNVVGIFLKEEFEPVSPETLHYFRDLYDHALHLTERADTHRESFATMMDMYLSSMSNKMNDTMKILTIFSATFIPLTFIAGVYGMNFEYMPELKWHYGYFFTLGTMVVIIALFLYFFKRKKWF